MDNAIHSLSIRYPADKFIHGLVGSINFYPPDNNNNKNLKKNKMAARQLHLLRCNFPEQSTSSKDKNFSPTARSLIVLH